MTDKKKGSRRNTSERIYLEGEEIKVLQDSLDEWNGKPDKKSRDAFVVAAVLPKIQQLNLDRFGPENLTKDKSAKILWERRIKVSSISCLLDISISHIFFSGNPGLVQKQYTIQEQSRLPFRKKDSAP